MSIWTKLFGKPEPVKQFTVKLRFRNLDNNGTVNLIHTNVVKAKVWFRVLADTPDCDPVTAIHMFELADGTEIMYRDDPTQRLMEFKTE